MENTLPTQTNPSVDTPKDSSSAQSPVASSPVAAASGAVAGKPPAECEGKIICGKCIKGGIPLKREFLSFLVIFLVGALTALTVFYVQAKREVLTLSRAAAQPAAAAPAASASPSAYPASKERTYATTIQLPAPNTTGGIPLNQAIATRRSRRAYADQPVSLSELSQLLWAGQGITDPETGKRAAPSARESYPMTIFVVVRNVTGLEPGLYEYLPKTHSLGKMSVSNVSTAMKDAAVQEGALQSPVAFLISTSFGNYQAKTKSTTVTATYMEAGHISQNMYLETESLGMSTVTMAGFDSNKVTTALQIDPAETVLYIMPFGHTAPEAEEE